MKKSEKAALLVYGMPLMAIAVVEILMFYYVRPMVWAKEPLAGSLWQFDLLGMGVIFALWYPIRKHVYADLMKD